MNALRTWWLDGRWLLPESWVRDDDWQLNRLGRLSNAYHQHTRWVRWRFWRYILERELHGGHGYWTVVRCRLRGHPHGEVFYNAGGMEPDHHCADCGELIG